jgi:glycerol-3-phosphate dehydrogenase (NAD(P)+)
MRVCVMGAGAWGTALTILLASKNVETVLWANTKPLWDEITKNRENISFFKGFHIPDSVAIEFDLLTATKSANILIVAVPGKYLAETAREFDLDNQVKVLSATKGIEAKEGLTSSEILTKIWNLSPDRIAVLSGPNFAREVAKGYPTASVVASKSESLATELQQLLSTETFRVYRSTDVAGVEIGSVLKNVVAIGAGIVEGLGYGANTIAALIVRGIEESRRLITALGADETTIYGLSCLGDMVATSFSSLSRNKGFGYWIGQGLSIDEAKKRIASGGEAIEGLDSLEGLLKIAGRYATELPIAESISKIVYGNLTPALAIKALMTRDLKMERQKN